MHRSFMGTTISIISFMLVLFLLLTIPTRAQRTTTETPKTEFIFRGFSGNQSNIVTTGAATIKPDGLLRLTDRNSNVTGTSFYHKPVRLLETNTSSTNSTVRSFSTSFVFVIIPTSSSNGGFGFTFTLSPTPDRTGAESAQYLGLLNKANDGNSTNHVFAVEFDTVQGFKDGADRTGNHIGLNFNSLTSDVQEPVVYYDNEDPNRKEDFPLQSGDPIRAILDYDGPTQTLNLTVYPANLKSRPVRPLISRPVPKLSQIVQEEMYVGFTAATGRDQSSAHYVMGWSFSSGGDLLTADTLDLLELPRPPPNTAKKRGTFFLADWVMELHARGEILHAVDPRLGFGYDGVEARLALVVGLLCCHQRPTSRPSMRMVLRYLNGDDDVPEIDNDWGYSDSSRSDLGSNFEGYVSSDRASSSVASFSVTRVSSSSVISGR
ncbi:unnamed protein product [Arabidopsis thaliana]|uniref:(thale cress) hypothetical protein n=1 Tax=Arabidopsis thaliana TaxID=3702 RepID=A0A7G2F6G5_ARATH|nr:unnamed protein product [Arabidopsis thaliana]